MCLAQCGVNFSLDTGGAAAQNPFAFVRAASDPCVAMNGRSVMVCNDGVKVRRTGFNWLAIFGTPRRFVWNVFRPGYVQRQLAERNGACRRCGACCQLVVKCPYYTEEKGLPSCKIYSKFRFPNCTTFPIDRHDLADRDRVFPHVRCGYSWGDASRTAGSGDNVGHDGRGD